MNTYNLEATYDSRDSFYGKARVIVENDEQDEKYQLYSYDTLVAEYDSMKDRMTVNGWFSATTARHINEFLLQHGRYKVTKQELENYTDDNKMD